MKALGPLWGLGLIFDRNLMLVFVVVNLAFAVLFVLAVFRGRRTLDRALIAVGLFFLLMTTSVAVLHTFAKTPIRDVQLFVAD